jgi:hypothetical protein
MSTPRRDPEEGVSAGGLPQRQGSTERSGGISVVPAADEKEAASVQLPDAAQRVERIERRPEHTIDQPWTHGRQRERQGTEAERIQTLDEGALIRVGTVGHDGVNPR